LNVLILCGGAVGGCVVVTETKWKEILMMSSLVGVGESARD